MPQISSGNLRALAVTVPNRIAELPNVPTLTESGVTDVLAQTWFALMAPANTPASIVQKIEAASRKFVASDDFKSKVMALSGVPVGSTAAELTARMKAETDRWSAVVKQANIKFE